VDKEVLVAIVKPILDKFLGGNDETSIPKFSLMGGIGNIVPVMQAINTAQEHLRKGTLAEKLVSGLSDETIKDIEEELSRWGYVYTPDTTDYTPTTISDATPVE